MMLLHHGRSPNRQSPAQRLRAAKAVALRLDKIRLSEELVEAFVKGCAADVTTVPGAYRARAFGFTAVSTAGRYQAVRNWIDQVLWKAGEVRQ